MSETKIEYDAETVSFTIGGETAVWISRDDAVMASLETIAAITTSSFERALTDYEEQDRRVRNAIDAHEYYLQNRMPPTFRKAASRSRKGPGDSPKST